MISLERGERKMYNKPQTLTNHQLAAWTKTVANKMEEGCSNSSCKIKPKTKGQHTNGACHCIRDIEEELLDIAAHISTMEIT